MPLRPTSVSEILACQYRNCQLLWFVWVPAFNTVYYTDRQWTPKIRKLSPHCSFRISRPFLEFCFLISASRLVDMFVHPLYSLKFLIENFGHTNCSIPLVFVSSKSKWLNDTAAQTLHKMEDISVFAIIANKLKCRPHLLPLLNLNEERLITIIDLQLASSRRGTTGTKFSQW